MDFTQGFILGIVQGLTEFLPISSSGHLVLFPYLMGWDVNPEANIQYDIIVHFGTLLALFIYFHKDVKLITNAFFMSIKERSIADDPYRRLAWLVIIGTIPTGIVYILIKDIIKHSINSPLIVGIEVIITGLILVISEYLGKRVTDSKHMSIADVTLIGFAQGIAIFPGISRSGATIAAGLLRGLTREEAARFSFILSIPVILAASLEQVGEIAIHGAAGNSLAVLIGGFIASAITGYFAIKYFIDYLKKHSLYLFALYCFALGAVTLVLASSK